jgi:L-threonylcarbamoyladenylate synthase
MTTQLISADAQGAVELAACLLRRGETIVIPTETVYGLAADATNPKAIEKIFSVKGRAADNPLIVHIAQIKMWQPLVRELPEACLRLAKAFWPGPLTITFQRAKLFVTCEPPA